MKTNGKSARRERVRVKRIKRGIALAEWCAKHPNNLTLAQLQHPQMRARFEEQRP